MRRRQARQSSNIFAALKPQQIDQFREAFRAIDGNQDGLLNRQKLESFLYSTGIIYDDDYLNELLPQSTLGFHQLLTMIGEKLDKTDNINSLRNALKEFERYENGIPVIDFTVFKHYLMNYGDKMTEEEVDFFVKGCLENGLVNVNKLLSVIKYGEVIVE